MSLPFSGEDDVQARRSIARAIETGVPPDAIAFYARWWQLETWLRQLAYLELRAKYGARWLEHLAKQAPGRAARDEANAYMATPDAANVLAYLDVGHLFELVRSDEHWPLFEPSLLPLRRWDGLVEELTELRNRNAHCRRPHPDDLNRIEQALRDLERGARRALEAFNTRIPFDERMDDPIAEGWLRRQHADAWRLVEHCERQYDTRLRLEWSARPWAGAPDDDGPVAGQEGLFVHAEFTLGCGYIDPPTFWQESFSRESELKRRLVALVLDSPWTPSFTFSAVDGGVEINDVVGNAFDALMSAHTYGAFSDGLASDDDFERWKVRSRGLDPRVHVDSPLALAHREQPFSVFGA